MTRYNLQYHQQMSEEDYENRVAACADLLDMQKQIPIFLDNLSMSDEATFNVNGHVNKHNCRIWGREKPAPVLTKNQVLLEVWHYWTIFFLPKCEWL